MKIARLKMVILFYVIVVGSMMGNMIIKTHNLPQNGDNFTKTRISFIAPGDSGKNVVWDFSQAQVIDGNTKVFYSVIDDSLINATEYGTLMGEVMNTSSQPYRYGGKELVTLGGLNLSDFGARWLDSPSGTFTTMDPLCEDFQHLSPYLYSAGNPIKYIDPSGKNIVVLFDPNGAYGLGHLAILIQTENGDWALWSKNGTNESSGSSGTPSGDDKGTEKFKTPKEFFNSASNKNEKGEYKYTEGYHIKTSQAEDRAAASAANAELKKKYNVLGSNCVALVQKALDAANKNDGYEFVIYSAYDMGVNVFTNYVENKLPKETYKRIKKKNKGMILNPNKK